MKKTKILAPALGILCLSMAASITGTVAWFSTNANVTAEGLEMTAETATNLFIKNGVYETGYFKTHPAGEADFVQLGSEGQKVDNIADTDEYHTGDANIPTGKAVGDSKNSPLSPVSTTDSFTNWVYVNNSALVKTGGQVFSSSADIATANTGAEPGKEILAMKSLDYSSDVNYDSIKQYCVTGCVYLFLQSAVNNKISVKVNVTPSNDARKALLPAVRVGLKFIDRTEAGTGGFVDTIFAQGNPEYYPCTNETTVSSTAQATQPFSAAYEIAPSVSGDATSGMKAMHVIQTLVFFWFEGQDGACVNSNSLNSDGYILDLAFTAASL